MQICIHHKLLIRRIYLVAIITGMMLSLALALTSYITLSVVDGVLGLYYYHYYWLCFSRQLSCAVVCCSTVVIVGDKSSLWLKLAGPTIISRDSLLIVVEGLTSKRAKDTVVDLCLCPRVAPSMYSW